MSIRDRVVWLLLGPLYTVRLIEVIGLRLQRPINSNPLDSETGTLNPVIPLSG